MTYSLANTVYLLSKQAHKLAAYFVRHRQDAEDVAQAALIRLFAKPETIAAACRSRQYVVATVRSTAWDFYRMQAKRAKLIHPGSCYNQVTGDVEVNEDGIAYMPVHMPDDPDISFEKIDNALLKLNDCRRQALELVADGRTYEEIAQIQEVPVGTVRSRINTGRRELKSLIGIEQ